MGDEHGNVLLYAWTFQDVIMLESGRSLVERHVLDGMCKDSNSLRKLSFPSVWADKIRMGDHVKFLLHRVDGHEGRRCLRG